MNRFKKELRKHGVRLECDYDYLPYHGLETVVVDSEHCKVSRWWVYIGWAHHRYDRSMECYPDVI